MRRFCDVRYEIRRAIYLMICEHLTNIKSLILQYIFLIHVLELVLRC